MPVRFMLMLDRLLEAVVRLAHMLIFALVAPIRGGRPTVFNSFWRQSAAGGFRLAAGQVGKRPGIVPKDGDPGPVKTAPPQLRARPLDLFPNAQHGNPGRSSGRAPPFMQP